MLRAIHCVYTMWAWSLIGQNAKDCSTMKRHGIDFVDAPAVFGGENFTFEDDRFSYNELRFVTLGLLAGIPVSIVHTETANEIRIISFRQATRHEAEILFSAIKD
jgi:uncharacterized protein